MDTVLADVQRQVDASTAAPTAASSSSSSSAAAAASAADTAARRALLRRKIQHAVEAMSEGLVERDTEVRLLLLAALAREHVLFIGPPGTAKSEVGRRLARLVGGATYFERLLTRFSVPEELFGPLSMRALEEDRYVRQTRGYLPEADVAFVDGECRHASDSAPAHPTLVALAAAAHTLNPATPPRTPNPTKQPHSTEIFKANSAILNALLTLLNERLFDNGSARVRVPLISMVGASNELPESEELDALYDRFLLRREVGQVSAGGLASMLEYYAGSGAGESGRATPGEEEASAAAAAAAAAAAPAAATTSAATATPGHAAPTSAQVSFDPALRLTRDDFDAVRDEATRSVRVPSSVIQLLADLRAFLQERCEPPVYVSDRRLVKSVALMQVAAYCDGRDSVTEYDCLLLEHVLWQRSGEARRVGDWVLGQLAADDGVRQVQYLMSGVFSRACKALGGALDPSAAGGGDGALAEIAGEAGALRELLADRLAQVTIALDGGFPAVLGNLWLGADEAEAVATALVPKLQRTKQAVTSLLFEAATLEVALSRGADAVALANLMPRHWADFIRNAPQEVVQPIGVVKKGGAKI
jgi:MoxR-like ATPase